MGTWTHLTGVALIDVGSFRAMGANKMNRHAFAPAYVPNHTSKYDILGVSRL
jgi:hypothetical protein